MTENDKSTETQKAETPAEPVYEATLSEKDAAPVEEAPETPADSDEQTPVDENHDEADVAAALQRETSDGLGENTDVPEADFDSFDSPDVEEV